MDRESVSMQIATVNDVTSDINYCISDCTIQLVTFNHKKLFLLLPPRHLSPYVASFVGQSHPSATFLGLS